MADRKTRNATPAGTAANVPALAADVVRAMLEARHGDPFAVLGAHADRHGRFVRALLPGAAAASVVDDGGNATPMVCLHPDGLFGARVGFAGRYQLQVDWAGHPQCTADPYAFGPLLGELDLHLVREGRHLQLADCLGAKPTRIDGVDGVRFAVWAPNASRVAVVGDFNAWDGRRHPMRLRHDAGVWELFVPGIGPGNRYKYEIRAADGHLLPLKADPVARGFEAPPRNASVVTAAPAFEWNDADWMGRRVERQATAAPMSIYEVHTGSWFRDGDCPDWDALGERLVPYVAGMGFTHIELLPVTEHPFTGSWGYQPLGLFAPTARHGDPTGFARFVDRCHREGVGVILDWVPAHFPSDAHGLVRFDGSALYEHADPREGFHHDWNTLIYNHGRNEVCGFLVASALEWLQHYHVDGLRVDAVASMLYRDYSRREGEWVPNVHGGRENYESIAFLRRLNEAVHEHCPGAVVIAEESTAWPGVSAPTGEGGLGFDYKWNMGWMHDTLGYIAQDPIHRRHHHHEMTFGLLYAFSERFVLPISHDEVVHGKGSLLGRMPGPDDQRFANLRAYLAFMWSHPGKKLLFMGCEFGQWREWDHDGQLDWHLLDEPAHRGVQRLVRDLNRGYASLPALHERDHDHQGFEWLVGDDTDNSVFAFLRRGHDRGSPLLAVFNMTPVARPAYRIGVPCAGGWREAVNTDATRYGGGGGEHRDPRIAGSTPAHGRAQSLELDLPPLSALWLVPA